MKERKIDYSLYKKLNIDSNKKGILSFVGGGGKTTTIFSLAEELKVLGKKVLISTTTHIFKPDREDFDNIFLKDLEEKEIRSSTITILGEKIVDGKIKGLDPSSLEAIIKKDLFDFILIEADGARGMPIKAPASYEPVILDSTLKTIGVIGLDALNMPIDKVSHRKEILSSLLKKDLSDPIEIEDIVKLVLAKDGLFKASKGEKILLLNKAIDKNKIRKAKLIRKALLEKVFSSVVIADILTKNFY